MAPTDAVSNFAPKLMVVPAAGRWPPRLKTIRRTSRSIMQLTFGDAEGLCQCNGRVLLTIMSSRVINDQG